MTKVITYQSPAGATISLTRTQATKLTRAGAWPKDSRGQEFCSVSYGLHAGEPTYTDAEIMSIVAQA